MLLGLPLLSPFSMTFAVFLFVSHSHVNRPLRMCKTTKSIIKLDPQLLSRKRMALIMSSLLKFAHLSYWRIDSVEIKHTKVT